MSAGPIVVYLAGGTGSGWQARARELMPSCSFVDPSEWAHETDPRVYTSADLDGIRRSEVVLAHVEASNPGGQGLCLEVGYAAGLGKPVAVVDSLADDPRRRYFGMVLAIGHVFPALEEACAFIEGAASQRAAEKALREEIRNEERKAGRG